MKNKLLVCDCSSMEHQIIFNYDKEDKLVYAHIHLSKRTFCKRLILGIKYILGYKCRFGHWEEFIFSKEHSKTLKEISKLLE